MSLCSNQPAHAVDSVGDSLLEREAAGLLWSIYTRLVVLAVVAVLSPLFTTRTMEQLGFWALCLIGAALMVYCRSLALRRRRLGRAGLIGALFDLSLLICATSIQAIGLTASEFSLVFMVDEGPRKLGIVLIVVNSLALRPRLPLLVAGGVLLLDLAVKAYVLSTPQVGWSLSRAAAQDPRVVFLPTALGDTLLIALSGVFLAWLARSARRAVRQAAAAERENAHMQQRQAEMLLEARVSSLNGLVAGIAHEVNTPLGVLLSAVSTAERGVPKISHAIDTAETIETLRTDAGLQRVLRVLAETPKVAGEAGQRIARLIGALKEFAHLDESDEQTIDVGQALDRSLEVVSPKLKGAVEIRKQHEETPPLHCRPRELNQVFSVILTNAFEAMDGAGTLTLDVKPGDRGVVVTVSDTGKGMSADTLQGLFEIRFGAGQGRMKMGLGLPTAAVIVQRLGGTITAESREGKGSRFTIELPVTPQAV